MNVEIGAEAALFPEKEYIKGILSVATPTFWRTFHHYGWKVQQKAAVATLCVLCDVNKHALKGVQKMAGPEQAVAAVGTGARAGTTEFSRIFDDLFPSIISLSIIILSPPDGKKDG